MGLWIIDGGSFYLSIFEITWRNYSTYDHRFYIYQS